MREWLHLSPSICHSTKSSFVTNPPIVNYSIVGLLNARLFYNPLNPTFHRLQISWLFMVDFFTTYKCPQKTFQNLCTSNGILGPLTSLSWKAILSWVQKTEGEVESFPPIKYRVKVHQKELPAYTVYDKCSDPGSSSHQIATKALSIQFVSCCCNSNWG